MKKICGWCHTSLGETDGDSQSGDFTTGICDQCADFFKMNKPGRQLKDFLNELPVPVAVVSSERRIEFANEQACDFLGKPFEEFKGFLGGEAFECAFARLPEGCGRTEHCKACTIRLTIAKTYETGEPQESVSAPLKKQTPDGCKHLRYKISTRKLEDIILLRIDEVQEATS